MLKEMGNAIVDLQVKYRSSKLSDRMVLKPALEELLVDYADYQLRLIKEGEITSEEDIKDMAKIKKEIDKAAKKESILKAISKTIAFIAIRV
jgi:hypothetical protein